MSGTRGADHRTHGEPAPITEEHVATASRPSDLRITDLRVANVTGVPFRSSIIRIDTNQGLSGYGEVRDQASATYALMLKSRLVGENPCNVDRIFRKIRQFGFHGRQGGGISGVEMALMDLAGKAYGVPAYALIGGRFRDEIRCYADTPSLRDPHAMGARLAERKQRGFTMLKMDVGIDLLWDVPGALIAPPGARADATTMHPFTGIQVTAKGAEHLASYVDVVRSTVGYDVALAADHFGHIALDSCIRLGRALEPFTLAWIEDLIPWQLTDQWRQLTAAVAVPTCTGEDIYLLDGFRPLLAAATENFLALEHHAAEVEFWSDLVTDLPRPLIQNGYITVPDTPGLGFGDIDEEQLRRHLDPRDPVFFAETTHWDSESSHDRLWS
jgi:L-alanine-DL-glutamate epimerase-like enolase superfamily enzyme